MLKFNTSCALLAYLSSNLLNEVGLSLFRYFEVSLRVCDIVVKKLTFAISSPDEFLYIIPWLTVFYIYKQFLSILVSTYINIFFSNRVVEPWNSLPAEPHHFSHCLLLRRFWKVVICQSLCNSRTILHCRSLDTCRQRCMFLTFFLLFCFSFWLMHVRAIL